MMKFFKIAGFFALVSVLISPALQAQDQEVVAKIGNKKITMSDLNKIIGYYDQEQRKVIANNPQLKETILWQVIQGTVISKIARDKGFDKKPNIRSQQELMINNFLATQYLQKEIIDKIILTEDKAKAYYKAHTETFKSPEMVRARHILIKAEPGASDEEKKKGKARAEDLLQKLKKGEDFAKLAAEVSDDTGTKAKGGDLDFFPKGTMIPAFDEAAFSLKPGELSTVVETEYGYHIIKVEEKKEALLEPYEKIAEKVKDQALQEMRKAAATEFVEKALKNAKVEINPGLITKPQK
ncbi:MAG: peptidylprolyl isomerase [Pseudomonadota bacterium]